MKSVFNVGLLLVILTFIGCGGGQSGVGGNSTGSSAITSVYKYYVYTANFADNTISSFSMNRNTGILTPIEITSAGLGANPLSLTINPSGDKLYVAKAAGADTSSNLQIFSIDKSTGALKPFQDLRINDVNNSPNTGHSVTGVSFSQNGSLVYVSLNDGEAKIYSVSSLTGKIILSKTISISSSTRTLIHPSGKFMFWGNGAITIWPINQTTGDIDLLSKGGGAYSFPSMSAETMVFSPDGNRIYIGSNGSGNINSYNLDLINGTASFLETTVVGSTSRGLAISNFGKALIAVESNSGILHSYLVNQSSGTLTEVDKKPTGAYPVHVAFIPDGNYAFVTNSAGNSLSTFSVEESTGAMKSIGTVSTGSGPLFTVIARIPQ